MGQDRPKYELVDIDMTGDGAVSRAFENQVAYCNAAKAPITARVVNAIRHLIDGDEPGALLDRIRKWQGAPLADALPLRVAGGIHSLWLSGAQPELGTIYRGEAASSDVELVRAAVAAHEAVLMPWLDGPPQTNEAGRSSNFMAAFLWLAGQGLPPRFECLEIGSSAGINLMMDRYAYDLGGTKAGAADPVMTFTPEWHGDPPPAHLIEIASLKGCDVAPVDLTDPDQALRLKAYIWPEHTVRFERMEAAVAAASEHAPDLVRMDAAEFVETELAKPQAEGTTRVLMHSIVWQYVPKDQQARISSAMEAAGAAATPERPLAWVAVEADRTVHRHGLKVRYWPGGEAERQLTWSHPHGADIEWVAG
ncbi:hypothetical protein A6F68_01442 [Tsuneonella dongtanensis]|uniref:DUF2332 domain-containing protein n=1 Tax=Tsuneonella dongtanensis TaxID=692370 RepID=A0A1B2ACY6_9SPHN|nr:DUF2332 domain-containing protein [Tsuneonella dongtanensis]ANY19958.1 hypothetical protein A6F68_01442 [Tsuneonella dongtanensis]